VGDSVAGLVIVSAGDVSLGLAAGVTVSCLCSQAASRAALARMQMYFFIVVVKKVRFRLNPDPKQERFSILLQKERGTLSG
jgi:hypothetical protein